MMENTGSLMGWQALASQIEAILALLGLGDPSRVVIEGNTVKLKYDARRLEREERKRVSDAAGYDFQKEKPFKHEMTATLNSGCLSLYLKESTIKSKKFVVEFDWWLYETAPKDAV